MKTKHWKDLPKAKREAIEADRKEASYASPFSGKNRRQRERLSSAFVAMQSALRRRWA